MGQHMEDDRLLEVVQTIKESHLSRTHFPKLMIGSGLSIIYEIAGMQALNDELNCFFNNIDEDNPIKEKWGLIKDKISEKGLESGLKDVDINKDEDIINAITECAANLILDDLHKNFENILKKETGFKKLLNYLLETCSANYKVIDVMTPNYDLIIELICDSLGVEIIDGFAGNILCKFNHPLLKSPDRKYSLRNSYKYVRLFKPHGSINWLFKDGRVIKINDYDTLKQNINCISIIAPGGDKYRQGMTTNEYRIMREEFNNLISTQSCTPILIYGYGFNYEHFNNALFENSQGPLLVISRSIKQIILEKLIKNENAIAFYSNKESNYLLFRGVVYLIDRPLWNIDNFSKIFFA